LSAAQAIPADNFLHSSASANLGLISPQPASTHQQISAFIGKRRPRSHLSSASFDAHAGGNRRSSGLCHTTVRLACSIRRMAPSPSLVRIEHAYIRHCADHAYKSAPDLSLSPQSSSTSFPVLSLSYTGAQRPIVPALVLTRASAMRFATAALAVVAMIGAVLAAPVDVPK
jgi:hypothetical protein